MVISLSELEEELEFVTHDERISGYTCILQAEQYIDEHYKSSYYSRIWVEFWFSDETSYVVPLSDAPDKYLYLAESFFVSGHLNPKRSLIGVVEEDLTKSRTDILERLNDRLAMKEDETIDDYNSNKIESDRFELRRFYDGVYKTAFEEERVFHKTAIIEERRRVLPALEVLDDLLLNFYEGNYKNESQLYISPTRYRHQIGSSEDFLNHKGLGKVLSKKAQEFPDISIYTNESSFKHPYVDWYCVDMAFYQVYAEAAKNWYFRRSGIISVLIDSKLEDDGKVISWVLKALWNTFWFVFVWALIAVGIFILYELFSPILGFVAIALVALFKAYQYKVRLRFNKILDKTRRLYGLVVDRNINWKLVGRELEDLRQLDVIYPQTTWNIVDRNKGL